MVKKRNHYVPQFLLRRFAARKVRKRHRLWQFRAGADPVEVVTKNAAVSTYFYGKPATGVEDACSDLEGKQASHLRDLDAGVDPNDLAQELRVLVWSLAFRTRALRSQFAEGVERAIDEMKAVDDQTKTDALGREISNNFDQHLDEVLASLPPRKRATVRQQLDRPGALDALKLHIKGEMSAFPRMVHELLDHVGGAVQSAADSGHIKGLTKLFAEGKGVPANLEVPNWSVAHFDPNTVVLGDGAVFAIGSDGECGTLGRFTGSYSAIYAPIAHDRVLVGRRDGGAPILGFAEINATSVRLSFDTFFASQRTDVEDKLATQIGTGEPLLSDDEFGQIACDSWKSLGGPPSEE